MKSICVLLLVFTGCATSKTSIDSIKNEAIKTSTTNKKNNPHTGTYSGFSETHSTTAFELLEGGKAVITTEHYDGEGDSSKIIDQKVSGTWEYKEAVLIIKYLTYEDKFFKDTCFDKPCFKYDSSPPPEPSQMSPLRKNYDFINWSAK